MNRVVRYRESGNRLGERIVLLDNIPANVIHDGGRLRFGPDGLLYNPAVAPSGASFYRGQRFTQFANNLFVGTLRGTYLPLLRVDPASRRIVGQERLLEGQFGRIRDVVSGPDGYLYFCTNIGMDEEIRSQVTIGLRALYQRPDSTFL